MARVPPDAAGASDPFAPGFRPAPTRAAATLILLRRAEAEGAGGLEVLLVQRNPGASFMPGVWVFPGGAVEASELIAGVAGGEPDADADELAHRAAALRELREEAGIELPPGAPIEPWSRWITPEPVPVRFDTRFYVAVAPPGATARADGGEVVASRWLTPARALELADAGELELVLPTVKNLESLLPYAHPDEVLAAARTRRVEPILPTVLPNPDPPGWRLALPGDEGYRPPRLDEDAGPLQSEADQ
jgi:8-oxo-dGTP pyrophosphatase MutT (NUDIX family)